MRTRDTQASGESLINDETLGVSWTSKRPDLELTFHYGDLFMEQLVFKGVAVYVDLQDEKRAPRVMSPHFTSMDGQIFLSGTLITTKPDHWAEGKIIHIPLNRIKSIIELGSEADVATHLAMYQVESPDKDEKMESGG
jgi:hypothetical protein